MQSYVRPKDDKGESPPAKKARMSEKKEAAKRAKAEAVAAVQLEATISEEAEKAGLVENLKKLAARTDIQSSGQSQAAMLKALKENRGLIHPAKRSLLGAWMGNIHPWRCRIASSVGKWWLALKCQKRTAPVKRCSEHQCFAGFIFAFHNRMTSLLQNDCHRLVLQLPKPPGSRAVGCASPPVTRIRGLKELKDDTSVIDEQIVETCISHVAIDHVSCFCTLTLFYVVLNVMIWQLWLLFGVLSTVRYEILRGQLYATSSCAASIRCASDLRSGAFPNFSKLSPVNAIVSKIERKTQPFLQDRASLNSPGSSTAAHWRPATDRDCVCERDSVGVAVNMMFSKMFDLTSLRYNFA